MPALHDPAVHQSICLRLQSLRPDAQRQWGKMTADQMLRHVNIALSGALGLTTYEPMKMPLPGPLFRFFAYNFPMPKGAPTHPNYVVGDRFDFDAEKARCLTLLEEFARKPMESAWPLSPVFGRVTGKFSSHVQAKHLDHHLRQFSA
jgi:hypothetical protein